MNTQNRPTNQDCGKQNQTGNQSNNQSNNQNR